MVFWNEVDSATVAEDREVRVVVVQGSECCLRVQALVATSSKGYSQGRFRVGAHGEPGTMSASGPSRRQVGAAQNLCLRATSVSGSSVQYRGYAYLFWPLDSVALTPLVNISFKSDPFPVIIHA